MSASFIDTIKTRNAGRLHTARAQYLELLRRADAPEPGDVDLLEQLLEALSLGPDDYTGHVAARRAAVALRANVLTDDRREQMGRDLADAKAASLAALKDTMRRLIEPLDLLAAYRVCEMILSATGGRVPDGPALPTDYPATLGQRSNALLLDLQNAEAASADAVARIRKVKADNPLAFGADEA